MELNFLSFNEKQQISERVDLKIVSVDILLPSSFFEEQIPLTSDIQPVLLRLQRYAEQVEEYRSMTPGLRPYYKAARVAQAYEEVLSKGVLLNYPLTELMPYNGGTVEVQVALLALKGTDYLGTTLKVLQDFSSLVVAPLGQAISLSQKLSNGIQTFLDTMNGGVHLSLHQAFTSIGGGGANILKPGYIAVILASADQVSRERLSVQNDRLYYKSGEGQQAVPFQGYDYMLLRVEGRQERDDWRLSNIQEPFNRAVEALLQGKENDMKVYKALTLATVYQSPDLVVHDRRRVAQTIKDELVLIEHEGLGAVGDEQTDLNVLMERAMDVKQAIALGNLSFEEIMS